ncbi:MAG TPA: response regulator [Labilithrix sp.]|jgi:two-component system phosphate regulon response regulator PhoB
MSNARPRQRVLVVDDDADTRDLYRWVFESRGYGVDEAENGAVGIARARMLHPDLIVVDNDMPVMSGVDAARVLRADIACAAIPIIMLSAGRPPTRDGALWSYVQKPVTVEALIAHARAALGTAVTS